MQKHILLIDDDEILRDLLSMHFELEGFQVGLASDGQSGLAAFREQGADVIVLDLMMPVMDGVRFMRALTADTQAPPPVIVLSAAGHGRLEQEMLAAGAHSVVRKPVTPGELLDHVRSALDPEP